MAVNVIVQKYKHKCKGLNSIITVLNIIYYPFFITIALINPISLWLERIIVGILYKFISGKIMLKIYDTLELLYEKINTKQYWVLLGGLLVIIIILYAIKSIFENLRIKKCDVLDFKAIERQRENVAKIEYL